MKRSTVNRPESGQLANMGFIKRQASRPKTHPLTAPRMVNLFEEREFLSLQDFATGTYKVQTMFSVSPTEPVVEKKCAEEEPKHPAATKARPWEL